jgi:hypothetical protein
MTDRGSLHKTSSVKREAALRSRFGDQVRSCLPAAAPAAKVRTAQAASFT